MAGLENDWETVRARLDRIVVQEQQGQGAEIQEASTNTRFRTFVTRHSNINNIDQGPSSSELVLFRASWVLRDLASLGRFSSYVRDFMNAITDSTNYYDIFSVRYFWTVVGVALPSGVTNPIVINRSRIRPNVNRLYLSEAEKRAKQAANAIAHPSSVDFREFVEGQQSGFEDILENISNEVEEGNLPEINIQIEIFARASPGNLRTRRALLPPPEDSLRPENWVRILARSQRQERREELARRNRERWPSLSSVSSVGSLPESAIHPPLGQPPISVPQFPAMRRAGILPPAHRAPLRPPPFVPPLRTTPSGRPRRSRRLARTRFTRPPQQGTRKSKRLTKKSRKHR